MDKSQIFVFVGSVWNKQQRTVIDKQNNSRVNGAKLSKDIQVVDQIPPLQTVVCTKFYLRKMMTARFPHEVPSLEQSTLARF